jgi:hypothetical protein
MRFTDEQLRALANAAQLYESWKEVLVQLSRLPGGMYWRVINSKEYLYEYAPGPTGQRAKSLGPRTARNEQVLREFEATKSDLEGRRSGIEARLDELAPAWRALRLPAIDRVAARILRALDQAELVGPGVLVVGTYALKAYEVESASDFAAGMDATEDLDFTLVMRGDEQDADVPRRLLLTLKQVDASFIVSPSSPRTVVNKRGYKVDLLTSTMAAHRPPPAMPWKPEPLEGQEWLLRGKPVDAVLVDFDGWPVALSAPDPRYFALHKLWLSKRPGRPGPKRVKDERQGRALLEAIRRYMPHYPIDDAFAVDLPDPLRGELRDAGTPEAREPWAEAALRPGGKRRRRR